MLNITSKQVNNVVTAFVEGRVDSTNAGIFDDAVKKVDVSERLIIDIENLEYISSAGLRILLKYKKLHKDLEIINASTDVYEVFDMTGFTEMMNIKRAYKHVSVEGAEIIGQGANGKIYRIDPDTVVKVYQNPDSLADIEHERDVARKALILGIPTAISYDIVKVGDYYASMFEMLNAQCFSTLLANHPENVETYAKQYVDLLKLIHSTEVPDGQLPDQRLVLNKWVKDLANYVSEDVYKKLSDLASTVPYDNHMIHGDYHTKNIMLQNDEVILIDMDTLAVGHPVLEFASIYNAYIGFYALDHDAIRQFLGIDYETGKALWENTLKLYYNTDNKAILELREKQAKTVGLIRLLRRTARRNGNTYLIDYCKKELTTLANELDTLI